ncbi:hypothetical protein H0A36_02925 [Endozoicomonas sp. SM1973]|uniref:Uncharacterized protein n=2 Tax=Spartinivicinus TaxID=2768738 RepID=A0A853I6V6_9GAMM|nr:MULTISPECIES: hypothetical protein [Spartinivicinus]MCX4029370.1 hypothetical protein [Spartinivicinus marinus]MDE1462203.1 hypothetical protein [Spartinivicinus sp. A2-2]NYZ64945.1 hypothetical protein [Spartinivicinus marinus]
MNNVDQHLGQLNETLSNINDQLHIITDTINNVISLQGSADQDDPIIKKLLHRQQELFGQSDAILKKIDALLGVTVDAA